MLDANHIDFCNFDPCCHKIMVMIAHTSKGLAFPVIALPGVGHMPGPGEDEKETARVFYVAATQRLVIGVGGDGSLVQQTNSQLT